MGETSTIQWTDKTWNPWHGCVKISPGCKYCYMFRDKERYGQDPTTVLRSKTTFRDPLKWNDPAKVFTCSWSDFFIEQADEWRPDAWSIIKNTPHLTYQILTKRPENIPGRLPSDWGEGYPNVWLGISAEDGDMFERRAAILGYVPAVIRFISFEPLLSRINPIPSLLRLFQWAIIGGESGNENGRYLYRPCDLDWIDELRHSCRLAGVTVFIKQTGTHIAKAKKYKDSHGGDMSEWPPYLRFREFPNVGCSTAHDPTLNKIIAA